MLRRPGVILSLGGVWALNRYLFEISFVPAYLPLILAFAAVSLLTVAVGMISSRGVHTSPPLEVLRSLG